MNTNFKGGTVLKPTHTRIPVLIGFAICFVGCPTDSGSNNGNGTGDCTDVCAVLMAAQCYYGGGEADCNASCSGWDTMYGAGTAPCQAAWAEYKACVSSASLDNCGGVLTWNVLECRASWDHTQNYCVNYMQPSIPCMTNAAWDPFCSGVAGKTNAKLCRGDVPAGCVVGGTASNADLYCCP
jgi:hypothetical protein